MTRSAPPGITPGGAPFPPPPLATREKRYEKAKAHVDKLTQSKLAKAFRGELVPQDPAEEPASELLKRIQEERRKQKAEVRPGRKIAGRRVRY